MARFNVTVVDNEINVLSESATQAARDDAVAAAAEAVAAAAEACRRGVSSGDSSSSSPSELNLNSASSTRPS